MNHTNVLLVAYFVTEEETWPEARRRAAKEKRGKLLAFVKAQRHIELSGSLYAVSSEVTVEEMMAAIGALFPERPEDVSYYVADFTRLGGYGPPEKRAWLTKELPSAEVLLWKGR